MMNNSLKSQYNFPAGTIVSGKWHQQSYTLIKELGYGANGIVYLAAGAQGNVALKFSDNHTSITSEVNVLKAFAKVQGSALGPSLLDVDDWAKGEKNIPFYCMEYIEGPDLLAFVQKKGASWRPVLILQLLKDLERLHQSGWVFGDLKPENLIVTGPPPTIRCIDVGGTTIQGRAIKEFTEFFDRGYWGAGSRKAEPAYDLFAAAMIMVNMAIPKRFSKRGNGLTQILDVVHKNNELSPYKGVLSKALKGEYRSAGEMREELLLDIASTPRPQPRMDTSRNRYTRNVPNKPSSRQQKYHQKKKPKGGLAETVLIILIVAALYFLYIYGQLL
ncbi:protein kinase domain-containing protein [Falsibacillus albus]|uniref:Protein kinase family protein n=1 Tax=Falsibacillus albus TaxID=2478915 RepID=A0A3L7JLQ7_9BACI|nr:serine/threonine-protein kinase [Falsibacillus albus]RLQ91676.1 protein kinase family protein [Falsibacillus albus]